MDQPYKTIKITNNQNILCYIAGLFDTAGAFGYKRDVPEFKVISQTSILEFLYNNIGGRINPNNKDSYMWIIEGDDLRNVFEKITPRMLSRKTMAIEFCTTKTGDKKKFDNIPDDCVPLAPWMAGFIDISSSITDDGKIMISSKNKSILEMFKRMYFGSVYSKKNGQDVYELSNTKKLFEDILPYLVIKKERILDIIKVAKPAITHPVERGTKDLPKGIYYYGRKKDKIAAQIRYNGKLCVLGVFEPEKVNEAEALYKQYKDAIEAEKAGGPKVKMP